jgi:hypothetical protein
MYYPERISRFPASGDSYSRRSQKKKGIPMKDIPNLIYLLIYNPTNPVEAEPVRTH